MQSKIEIVDRGRGPQLSTSRVTVQDLVPYFHDGCTHDEIRRWIPSLSVKEIQTIEHYIARNYDAVMQEDRRIREANAQRVTPLEIEKLRQKGRAMLEALKAGKTNGEPR
jgi:uncharacterized protein (DUF433 family)